MRIIEMLLASDFKDEVQYRKYLKELNDIQKEFKERNIPDCWSWDEKLFERFRNQNILQKKLYQLQEYTTRIINYGSVDLLTACSCNLYLCTINYTAEVDHSICPYVSRT